MIIHVCPAFSEAMSVSSGGSAQPVIEYNGHCVTQVNNSRLLGVIVDDNLSGMTTLMLFVQLARKTGALRRTFRQLTPSARRLYFIFVIQLDLEYAMSAILPSMSEFNRNRLNRACLKVSGYEVIDRARGSLGANFCAIRSKAMIPGAKKLDFLFFIPHH